MCCVCVFYPQELVSLKVFQAFNEIYVICITPVFKFTTKDFDICQASSKSGQLRLQQRLYGIALENCY